MQIISIIVAFIAFALVLILGLKTRLLREKDIPGSPFSLSKFQLWIWTAILCPAFILHWGYHGDTHINNTFLILIGISASVALTSGIITQANAAKNNADMAKGMAMTPMKANGSSAGFWIDLLKGDSDTLSVERLQHLVFTFVYICIYVAYFCTWQPTPVSSPGLMNFIEFDSLAYVLMGISSAGYLVGKGVNR